MASQSAASQSAAAPNYPGMERWRGKVALVTGASAGIGYEVARQLVDLGMNVVGCARNPGKIQALADELRSSPGKLVAMKCDVRKEEDILATFEAVKAQFGGVDVCINNAGLAHGAPLLSGATSNWRDMFEVDVIGLCVCTREFVKQLKERGVDDGHIILLNSMSGHRVALAKPDLHFHSAMKYAVTAITEGLRQELKEMNSNIKVTAISPGVVRTEFRGRMNKVDNMEQAKKDYDAFGQVLEVEDIASAIIYAISTPPRMQIHDILVRFTAQSF